MYINWQQIGEFLELLNRNSKQSHIRYIVYDTCYILKNIVCLDFFIVYHLPYITLSQKVHPIYVYHIKCRIPFISVFSPTGYANEKSHCQSNW